MTRSSRAASRLPRPQSTVNTTALDWLAAYRASPEYLATTECVPGAIYTPRCTTMTPFAEGASVPQASAVVAVPS